METKMKKTFRIILAIVLSVAIVLCIGWYLFVYDQAFTRDMLLYSARAFERSGNHSAAAWFYDLAYQQAGDSDAVAIELASQYRNAGNYTKAEDTLFDAIAEGGGPDLFVALSSILVEQDKLLDAEKLLSGITNPEIKEKIDALRPAAPVSTPAPGFYSQYIPVTVTAEQGSIYISTDETYPSLKTTANPESISLTDGENTIWAITVGENGLVSTLSIFGYTVGGVKEEVVFADAAVEAAVRTTLGIEDGSVVMTNDLWTIKEFQIPENTASLDDLKHMIHLEKLTIHAGPSGQLNRIAGLSELKQLSITGTTVTRDELKFIGGLPTLESLTIRDCGLSTTEGLASLAKLTYLDLSDNTIRNIDALRSMPLLDKLYLQHNAVTDLTPLSGLRNLIELDISHNSISSLSPLVEITTLEKLIANTNKLTTTSGLINLTALTELDLGYNMLTSVGDLTGCKGIKILDISNNSLTDISSLTGFASLEDLDFSYNQVTAIPAFDTACVLVSIDGSHNNITALDPLSGLQNLNNVYMDYNTELSSVEPLAKCPLLILVNVYGTKVKDVSSLEQQSIIVNYNPIEETAE